jgi:pilus assembly protein CpaF
MSFGRRSQNSFGQASKPVPPPAPTLDVVTKQTPVAAPAAPKIANTNVQPTAKIEERVSKVVTKTQPQHTERQDVADTRDEEYYRLKASIYNALIETIDLGQLAQLDLKIARDEIRDIVNEIIAIKQVVISTSEQEQLLGDIINDVLGYGPLEPLLARDDIADIMINGANAVFIEVGGKVTKTPIRFRDNQQLMNICQRIVSQVGRRVDEASPICDARLPDGSRVNVIVPQ